MKQKILVVDDDPALLSLLQTELSEEFEVLIARNGKEGLGLSIQYVPQLIISDIKMPEMNGWQFFYLTRQNPATKTIPFVFLSSRTELPIRVKSLKLGADDFIEKPFTIESLLNRIRFVFKRVCHRKEAIEGNATFDDHVNTLMIDLLEYLRGNRRSGIVEFQRPGQHGWVTVFKGQITGAIFEEHEGKNALRTMILLESGEVAFKESNTEKGAPLIKDWPGFLSSFLPE